MTLLKKMLVPGIGYAKYAPDGKKIAFKKGKGPLPKFGYAIAMGATQCN